MKRVMLVLILFLCAPACEANVFNDPNCMAVYRFESGALTTDSSAYSHTLTSQGSAAPNTVDYQEGAASVIMTSASSDRMTIADADLDPNFPFQSSGNQRSISVTFWFSPDIISGTQYCVSHAALTQTCFNVYSLVDLIVIQHGYDSGASIESTTPSGTGMTVNQWYFVAATLSNPTGAWTLDVWGETEAAWTQSQSGTFANANSEETDALLYAIGSYNGVSYTGEVNGLIDEMVFFNDILTADEIVSIRGGTFGEAATGTSDWWYRRRHN